MLADITLKRFAVRMRDLFRTVLVVLGLSTCMGCFGSVPANAQEAKTPEMLVANQIIAVRDENLGQYLANLESHSRTSFLISAKHKAALADAIEAFHSALDKRFGAGPSVLLGPGNGYGSELAQFASAEPFGARVTGDRAEIQVRTKLANGDEREDTTLALREGNSWRLVITGPSTRDFPARVSEVEKVTRGVLAGTYGSREDAMIAADSAMRGRRQ